MKCAKCGAEVKMVDGKAVRSCSHDTAPITADLSAKLASKGSLR